MSIAVACRGREAPEIDPSTQDTWVVHLMGVRWHKYKAGALRSVCGVPWSHLVWNVRAERPAIEVCVDCVLLDEIKEKDDADTYAKSG